MCGASGNADLAARAAAGDRGVLEQLLLAHHDGLAQYVARRFPAELSGLLDVEDILHRTYVQVFRAIGRFEPRGPDSFSGWLRTIALHQLTDALRRRHREGVGGAGLQAPADTASCGFRPVDNAAAKGRTPSSTAAHRDMVRRVQQAVAGLPEDQRAAIRLHYLQGRSLEETAQAMSVSLDAARGLCYRARKKLRDLLGSASLFLSG